MSIPKAIFCWSGGKDSAYCLHKVLTEKQFDVTYLLTTINQDVKRISMHGIREALLDKQIEAIGIPVLKVGLTTASNEAINVSVFDVLGKQVVKQTLTTNRLNVSNLKAGMYLLNIEQNGASTTKKLVIE